MSGSAISMGGVIWIGETGASIGYDAMIEVPTKKCAFCEELSMTRPQANAHGWHVCMRPTCNMAAAVLRVSACTQGSSTVQRRDETRSGGQRNTASGR